MKDAYAESERECYLRSAIAKKACSFFTIAVKAFGLMTILLVPESRAFTTVKISTSAPVGIETDFIQQTTTHFNVSYFKNPLVANTYAITIFGPREAKEVLGTSFGDCISQGFADGMDYERFDESRVLQAFQDVDISSVSCAGIVVDSVTATYCQYVYSQIKDAIMKRWGIVFSSTGAVVAQ